MTPITSIDSLWKEYSAFEQGINKQLAEKLIHDRTRDYLNARRSGKVCVLFLVIGILFSCVNLR